MARLLKQDSTELLSLFLYPYPSFRCTKRGERFVEIENLYENAPLRNETAESLSNTATNISSKAVLKHREPLSVAPPRASLQKSREFCPDASLNQHKTTKSCTVPTKNVEILSGRCKCYSVGKRNGGIVVQHSNEYLLKSCSEAQRHLLLIRQIYSSCLLNPIGFLCLFCSSTCFDFLANSPNAR